MKTFIKAIANIINPEEKGFKKWLCHGCQVNKKRHCSKFCQECSDKHKKE